MRIAKVIFYMAVAVSSHNLSVAQTTTDVNEFEIKGIKLGMTEDELFSLIGNRINPREFSVAGVKVGIPVDRDRSFRFVVTGDSGSS